MISYETGLLFCTALFIALLGTGFSFRLALWIGALDLPNERSSHSIVIPRLGGVGIASGVLLALLLFYPLLIEVQAYLAGALIIVALGIADDRFHLRALYKFLGQIAAVALFIWGSGVQLSTLGDILGVGELQLGVLAPLVTLVGMVGVVNAVNLSDGLDGLAGGIALLAAFFLACLAYQFQSEACFVIAVALMAALIGFLKYNTHPARTFMGDTGSLFLGYTLAVLAVLLARPGISGEGIAPITIALVLALPILDTISVMARRIWHGYSPFLPDKTHLHHRLLDIGFSHGASVSVIYLLMAAYGVLALTQQQLDERTLLVAGLLMGSCVYLTVALLQHFNADLRAFFSGDRMEKLLPWHNKIAAVVGKSTRLFAVFLLVGLLVPAVALGPVSSKTAMLAFFTVLIIAALFPWRSGLEHKGLLHGTIYLATIALLTLFYFGRLVIAPWLHEYLTFFTIVVVAWVYLKISYRSNHEVLFTSGFELLILALSWFVPIFLLPQLGVPEGTTSRAAVICLQAIPVLLAMKILIRNHPERNRSIMLGLLVAISFISLRGILGI